jgi:hypothetical protein
MRRILMLVVTCAALCVLAATSARAFSWIDVRDMKEAGEPDSVIAQKITTSGVAFHLFAPEIKELKASGVSDALILLMLQNDASEAPNGTVVPAPAPSATPVPPPSDTQPNLAADTTQTAAPAPVGITSAELASPPAPTLEEAYKYYPPRPYKYTAPAVASYHPIYPYYSGYPYFLTPGFSLSLGFHYGYGPRYYGGYRPYYGYRGGGGFHPVGGGGGAYRGGGAGMRRYK